jgi:hypothetical protein
VRRSAQFPQTPFAFSMMRPILKRMNVRANRSMKGLLGVDAGRPECIRVPCPAGLAADLQSGFKEVDGCVVPGSFESDSIWSTARPRVNNRDDETGFECSLSKIHVEDFVADDLPLSDLARLGIAYALRLRDALLRSVLSGTFRIIVDAQLPNPDLDVHDSVCTVRFHKARPGQVWLDDDLDVYKLNAVLVIELQVPLR